MIQAAVDARARLEVQPYLRAGPVSCGVADAQFVPVLYSPLRWPTLTFQAATVAWPLKEVLVSSPSRTESGPQKGRILPSRRAVVKGAAWATPVAAFSVGAPALAFSPSCETDTVFNSQSRARMLSGALFGTDLDGLADVQGVHARAFLPAAPNSTGGSISDVQASPLNVTALGAIELELGGVAKLVSQLLTNLTSQDVGAVAQVALAHEAVGSSDVAEVGAAGTVNQATGAVTLDPDDPSAPELASLDLYTLLQQATGTGVAELLTVIADLKLQIGAVAGRAFLDMECNTATNQLEEQVDRDYVLAYLRLLIKSDVAGTLLSALTSALPTLTVDTDAVWDALEAVPALGPLLAALGRNALQVTATVDTTTLANPPQIPADPNSAILLDLNEGTIVIDVANLLGGAYPGTPTEWLNSLSPNTRLFVDTPLPTDPAVVLIDILLNDLIERLKDMVYVRVQAGRVSGLLPTGLLIEGSLRDFLEGDAAATLVLAGVPVNLGTLLNPLLASIGNVVQNDLTALLRSTLSGVNGLLASLFDVLAGVLSLTINAQNKAGGTMPGYYAAITPERRYDVAALHLELLGMGNLLNLSIARGSVGQNEYRDGATAPTNG